MRLLPTLVSTVAASTACATLPDDAPQEFTEAESALERLDEQDADEYLPRTVHRAHQQFNTAVETLAEAGEEGTDAFNLVESAKLQATEAEQTANTANRFVSSMREWDAEKRGVEAALVRYDRGSEEALAQVAQPAQMASPFAALDIEELSSPVAYFPTNSATPERTSESLGQIANLVTATSDHAVVLTGHADKRGPAKYNEHLAMNRAQAVADRLIAMGVPRERITIRSVGEQQAEAPTEDIAQMQLDRHVSATVPFQRQ